MATATGRTLTFLFTDIEDSTRRWQEDRDAMTAALAAHDAMLVRAIEANGGNVFKHTGDGLCATFESAASAVAAAYAAQQELELPVRMGVHTGEAEERDGDFYGMTLNRCARIMDAGHGGQVLLSSVTAGLLDGEFVDLGEHVLKGVNEPERILQLGTETFPALRVAKRRSAVPAVLTSLVGRDELVGLVVERLSTDRLVTLVGVGGVGKTRVALAAAERLEPDRDLVVFVPLNEVSDEEEVLPALGRALGLTAPSLAAVAIALSSRRALIVLDNCEHVIDAAADLVEEVLAALETVTVLATSREGLAVDGEQLVAVPGLDGSGDDAAAVALFIDRARNVDSAFELDAGDATIVGEICRRLDGLPLAIELAAARANVLAPRELLERLDERFDVPTGGRRRRSRDRQKTLRETVDWSYELLDGEERNAFEQLSVFAGSFGLTGAEAVLDGFSAAEVLDLVESLVSKSLLNSAVVDGFHRYRYSKQSGATPRSDSTPTGRPLMSSTDSTVTSRLRSVERSSRSSMARCPVPTVYESRSRTCAGRSTTRSLLATSNGRDRSSSRSLGRVRLSTGVSTAGPMKSWPYQVRLDPPTRLNCSRCGRSTPGSTTGSVNFERLPRR